MKGSRRRSIRAGLLLLVCLALIVVIFAAGILNKQKVWTDLPLDYSGGKMSFRTDLGDVYGNVASGPYYDLPEGTYRIKWQMEGDGENAIVITCSNGVEITPNEIFTTAGEWQGEAEFEVKGPAHNVSFNVKFCEGTQLDIYNFRLYSPEYTDNAFSAAALLLIGWLLFVFRDKLKNQEMRESLVILGMAVVFASLPFLREDSLMSWDVQYHTLRIMNLADGLLAGQFPVRCGGFSYNGYGAVTSVFYPDLFIYPLALLAMGGASLSYIVSIAGISVNALSAVTMYTAAKSLLKNHTAALCASVLFVFSMFRMRIEYGSYMLGWLLGMAFMPMFFREMWEIVVGDKRRWVYLALCATLIFQSHLLSVVLCACAAAGMSMVFLPRILREKRILSILKAMILALMLNGFMLLPMMTMYLSGVNTPAVQFGFAGSALEVFEVFRLDGYVGLPLLIGTAALLVAGWKEDENHQISFAAWAFAGAGAFCALLSTKLIPWSYIVKLTGGLVEVLQFPWRMMALAAVFLSIAGGYGYTRLMDGKGIKLTLCVLALSIISTSSWMGYVLEETDVLEFGQGANAYIITPEYQIEGTNVAATRNRDIIIEGDVQVTAYEKKGTRITAQVNAEGEAWLTMPLFGFDGYVAEINGEKIDWKRGENNRLAVELPAGTQGELRIWYEGKEIWRVTDVISLVTALCLVGTFVKKRRLR